MKRIALAGIALIAGVGTVSAEVVDGRWSIFGESCGNEYADDIMTLDSEGGEIGFYESGCDIVSWAEIGTYGGAWRAALSCSGEGETWTEKVIIGLSQGFDDVPDQLALVYLTDGFTTIYRRCTLD